MKHVGIIGGGVIGLCTAYYLSRAGHRITILDESHAIEGCSFGNAGMIVPSHFVPLAAPGMVSKGLRWMFSSTSPLYVRPRLSVDLLRWGWNFYRSATAQRVAAAAPALMNFSLLSKQCHQRLSRDLRFDLQERGLMMLFQREETGKEELETVEMAHRMGMEAKVLTPAEVQAKEPHVTVTALGGIFFPGDAHISPSLVMSALRAHLSKHQVSMITEHVTGFETQDRQVKRVVTKTGSHVFDEVVLATGAWSQGVAAHLGLNLPLQAGKGYSFTLNNMKKNVTIPTIFLEDRVAVTPMGDSLRFGGTMEIGGINHEIDMNRVQGIVQSIPRYYPAMNISIPDKRDVWHGLRPCSPDGLPFIGRCGSLRNVTVATGHGMMGISLGPGTGQVVADIVDDREASVDIRLFSPDRFN